MEMLLAGMDSGAQTSTCHRSRAGTAVPTAESRFSHHIGLTFFCTIHHDCLGRIIAGILFSNQPLTTIIRFLLQLYNQFVARIKCWEGGVLPELFVEGSTRNTEDERGA